MKSFQDYRDQTHEEGEVLEIIHSIIRVSGLPGVTMSEMLVFENGQLGQVIGVRRDHLEVLLLSRSDLRVGEKVARTGFPLQIEVSQQYLGQVIGPLGNTIEGEANVSQGEMRLVDAAPSGIAGRTKISRSLETGVILVDLMIPLGMGQRETVLGDRKTGKSYLARETAVHQAQLGNLCIYALIGKKKSEIKQVVDFFRRRQVMMQMVLVVSSSHASVGEVYLTPYTAMTMAEYFRDAGRNVMVVLDDMTTHAKYYRELSLLARKFPGRDSYPGDVFHIHSRLVERAGNFQIPIKTSPSGSAGSPSPESGEGRGEVEYKEVAITCLPIADVTGSDLTGYVQTNLMSMTDGHVLFSEALFAAGRRPAIDPFLSVTRVGHQTQNALRRDVSQKLYDLLSNYERTQSFLRFGAELGENSRQTLAMGERVIKFFDQPSNTSVSLNLALVLLGLLWSGAWNGESAEKIINAYNSDPNIASKYDNVLQNITELSQLVDRARQEAENLLAPSK